MEGPTIASSIIIAGVWKMQYKQIRLYDSFANVISYQQAHLPCYQMLTSVLVSIAFCQLSGNDNRSFDSMSMDQTFLIADDTVSTDHLSTSTYPSLVIINVLRSWTPTTNKGYGLAQCFSNIFDSIFLTNYNFSRCISR